MVASSRIHVLLDSHAQPHACMAVQRCRPEHTLIFVSGFSNLTDLPHHIFNASRLALDTKLAAQYIMATTTTIQVPAAPPTPKTSSNHNSSALSLSPSSSSTTTTATTQSNLTKRQLSLVSSGGNVSSPVTTPATPGHQRPNLTLQTTTRLPTPASTPSRAMSTSSQPPSAGSQTQFHSPTAATAPPHACSSTSSPVPLQPQQQISTSQTPVSSPASILPSQLPNTTFQVQSCSPTSGSPNPHSPASNSPISGSTPSRQATPSPQTPTAPGALPPAPRNLAQRVSDKLGVWTTIGLTTVAIVVAIYYGAVMLSYARWTKHNDFREGCISDREHELPLSAECLEELLRPRASVVKRQIEEAAHGFLSGEHSIRFTWVELAGSFVLGFAAGIGFDSLLKAKKPVPDVDIGAALRWLSRKTKAVVRGYGSYFAMLINVAWYSAMGLVVVFVGPFLLCCFLVVERREIFIQLRDTHSKAAQERRNLSGSLG
jgi:hypothetical protein